MQTISQLNIPLYCAVSIESPILCGCVVRRAFYARLRSMRVLHFDSVSNWINVNHIFSHIIRIQYTKCMHMEKHDKWMVLVCCSSSRSWAFPFSQYKKDCHGGFSLLRHNSIILTSFSPLKRARVCVCVYDKKKHLSVRAHFPHKRHICFNHHMKLYNIRKQVQFNSDIALWHIIVFVGPNVYTIWVRIFQMN